MGKEGVGGGGFREGGERTGGVQSGWGRTGGVRNWWGRGRKCWELVRKGQEEFGVGEEGTGVVQIG